MLFMFDISKSQSSMDLCSPNTEISGYENFVADFSWAVEANANSKSIQRAFIKGGEMRYTHKSMPMVFALFLWLVLPGSLCFAIDNPDAPDFVAEFEARALKFETDVQNQGLNTNDTVHAYVEYEAFLDQELNQTYSALIQRIGSQSRKSLMDSQKRWLQFRDAEFLFVANNWTVENFGTSSALSIGVSRTKIIRDRVIELLHYLKNY
jgi:uncharacterized protein YecT (DUF1311 family)